MSPFFTMTDLQSTAQLTLNPGVALELNSGDVGLSELLTDRLLCS